MIYDMNNFGVIDVGEDYQFLFLVNSQNFNVGSVGRLQGKGIFDITANFSNDGIVSPGGEDLVGELEIINNFSMSSSAQLSIDIHGTAIGAFDHMNIFGTPDLNGSLDIRLNYDANVNDEFEIVNATLGIGSCNFPDQVMTSYNGFDYVFDVICNSNTVVLRVQQITLSLPELDQTHTNFMVVPNPVEPRSQFMYDENFLSESHSIRIFNILGREILNLRPALSDQYIRNFNLQSGVYIAELSANTEVIAVTKFIVP